MLVSALVQDMLREWGERGDDADRLLMMERWVKSAVDEFLTITNFRASDSVLTVATVSGTKTVTLPSNVATVRALRYAADDVPILESPTLTMQHAAMDLTTRGKPREYFFLERTVVTEDDESNVALTVQLYPVPDAVYSLKALCVIHPLALVANNAIPVKVNHLGVITNKIRWFMRMWDKDGEGADRYDQKFMQGCAQAISNENYHPDQTLVMGITDVPGVDRGFARLNPSRFNNRGRV